MGEDDLHLTEAEAFTVHLEQDPLLRSTIVAVALLDRSPDHGRLAAAIERATLLEPNFRRRIEPGLPPLVPARWHDDPDFDLAWHLRRIAVPPSGTFDDVLEFARITGTTPFDPARPRWEFTLLDGLPDGTSALVMKVHHALTDGIGGIQLAQHVVDLDRRGTRRPPVPVRQPVPDAGATERATDAVAHSANRIATTARDVAFAVPRIGVGALVNPWATWKEVSRGATSLFRFLRPIRTTLSPVMTERRLGWHYRRFDVPIAGLKRAGAMADGTMNDAFLAGLAGGLGRYHDRHGMRVEHLRVTMPISTRRAEDRAGGNHITLARLPIPIGDHDPVSRMLAIDHECNTWRSEPALAWGEGIAGALNLLPTTVAAGMLKHVDVVASNVPGFGAPVFVGGARVERFYAFGPTLGAASNVTLMSYRDQCCIGVTTDSGAVPDADEFVACLREGFDELVEMAEARPG